MLHEREHGARLARLGEALTIISIELEKIAPYVEHTFGPGSWDARQRARELASIARAALADAGAGKKGRMPSKNYFPDMPPALPGESDEQYTDRLTGADRTGRMPYNHRRNRQCSIGYHDECSDPSGAVCECPCHAGAGKEQGDG